MRSWEKQTAALLAAGYRVITYDRRGFGQVQQDHRGYDYDTFAADLNTLLTTLDLSDAVLVGFSMGTGEVARYLGTYGSERVAQGSLPRRPWNRSCSRPMTTPAACRRRSSTGLSEAVTADRYAFFTEFFKNFYNSDTFLGTPASARRPSTPAGTWPPVLGCHGVRGRAAHLAYGLPRRTSPRSTFPR